MPSGLRSFMLPRTGKGSPAAAQLIRGIVPKLNSSSVATLRIWGIRSREREDSHLEQYWGSHVTTRMPPSHPRPMFCISVKVLLSVLPLRTEVSEVLHSPFRPWCPTCGQVQASAPPSLPSHLLGCSKTQSQTSSLHSASPNSSPSVCVCVSRCLII